VTTIQAVQRCLDAYTRARSLAGPDDAVHGPHTLARINRAYRRAMPFLTPDPDAIDTFIACVTHGIILQVFEPAEASKLLYAAQIAISSNRARTQAAKAQSKSHPQTQSIATPSPLSTDGGEAAGSAPQVPSPRVGDHEPQPEGAPGPSHLGTGEQCHPAAQPPQAPPTPSHLPSNKTNNLGPKIEANQAARDQLKTLVEQFYGGELGQEGSLASGKMAPRQAPPSPQAGTHPAAR
jgi:hypothetical protein